MGDNGGCHRHRLDDGPQVASAQVKTNTTAATVKAQVQAAVQGVKAKRLTRMVDESLTGCSVYSPGRSVKPPVTYITRADKARVKAEARMLLNERRNDSDLVTFYSLTP